MEPKMLREITNDVITPKKRDRKIQNDLYEIKIDEINDGFYTGSAGEIEYDDESIPKAEF